ncbi:MAG: hypothetical protein QME96_03235 [Myxococcota bacterium]|nr:hypothetical protein [Myxococcota bacterium]
MGTRDEFVERYVRAILDLPQDARAALDIIDDADVDLDGRVAACGVLMSVLQPGEPIPESFGPLALLDDAILLRLAVDAALPAEHPRRPAHMGKHPEFYDNLADDLAVARAFLGGCFVTLEQRLRKLGGMEHKGRKASTIADDDRASTWLFEEFDEAMTEAEIDEDQVVASMRKLEQVVGHLRKRLPGR